MIISTIINFIKSIGELFLLEIFNQNQLYFLHLYNLQRNFKQVASLYKKVV